MDMIKREKKERQKVEKLLTEHHITPGAFLEHLYTFGSIKKEDRDKPYEEAIQGKCRYFAPWLVAKIAGKNKEMQSKFQIHEGAVNHSHHVWVTYGDYIIDGTISQFYPEKKGIHILEKNSAKPIYGISKKYSLKEWLDKEERSVY